MEQLLLRGQQGDGAADGSATLMSASETERIIEQLQPLSIEEVGSQKWQQQHDWIDRLNLQAHYNAQSHSDEFVVELLVSLDKMQVLVHDLLLVEAWKQHVYPHLRAHLADKVDPVTSYLLLYHEATVANLLEVTLFHAHAIEALPEEYLVELGDWAYRKLVLLNEQGAALAEHKERSAQELMAQSRLDELQDKSREVEFGVAMCGLTLLRYLTDHLLRLPMGVLSRIVSTNDTLMGLMPLLDKPPWVRTRIITTPPAGAEAGGKPTGGRQQRVVEKWQGNRWAVVPPADRFKLTQADGQVWLAITNLLVEPRCRAKYPLDGWRKERLLGMKRHLNELLFDQLPVLKDLQRVLDEMALGVLPDQQSGKAALILEAVPVVREAMLRGRDWRALAAQQAADHFGEGAQRMARERLEAMIKALDFMVDLEGTPAGSDQAGQQAQPEAGAAAAAAMGAEASSSAPVAPEVKVSTWRKVHDSGVYEPWYDFSMEIDDSKAPEPVEVAAGPPGGSGSAHSGGGGAVVYGLRYRLKALDLDATRPLPANGKAVVRHGQSRTEALLQLPELPLRDSTEGAPVLWVTVGLLAVDGLALQVKLKKAPKPKERDRVAGVWYAYHPVAGALTVLRDTQPHLQPQGVGAQPAQPSAAAAENAKVQPVAPAAVKAAAAPAAKAAAAPSQHLQQEGGQQPAASCQQGAGGMGAPGRRLISEVGSDSAQSVTGVDAAQQPSSRGREQLAGQHAPEGAALQPDTCNKASEAQLQPQAGLPLTVLSGPDPANSCGRPLSPAGREPDKSAESAGAAAFAACSAAGDSNLLLDDPE